MRFFFFNDTATTEIYTLSLHDALPISCHLNSRATFSKRERICDLFPLAIKPKRSEEHTSELQSQSNLVCRLLLEKKKKATNGIIPALYGYTYRSRVDRSPMPLTIKRTI